MILFDLYFGVLLPFTPLFPVELFWVHHSLCFMLKRGAGHIFDCVIINGQCFLLVGIK